ncbi:hypothetical protein [Arthrobacter caoxuetaonis]|uniref:Uncharacterized protein n=1 Tax=Arthrobacter caoxuetaonis TaxID=2886935 RepID=A0A9X1MFX0_9MICC|nr:hypothetical protein [Arthrobacter caoxuetaonis]MCC3299349.1 hypothetical protein [Arthrobacter caoxuetaonis]USQ59158.1 hypothetical protein NF551_18805 [Arthrobacter caoxuetaonis]
MFASRRVRAERRAMKDEAARAAAAAEPKYEIINVHSGEVLQQVSGARAAQSAQEDWYSIWLNEMGPRTTIRPVPSGIPDSCDTIDALILQEIPERQQDAYARALRLIIMQRTPLEELLWVAEGSPTGTAHGGVRTEA